MESKVTVRGIKKFGQVFVMTMAAYNLVRMRTLGKVRLGVRNEHQGHGKALQGT